MPIEADVDTQGATDEDLPQSPARKIKRRRSISAKIIGRILPLVAVPLLLIGAVAIGAIALIQARTDSAVDRAETVLTEQVVEDGVNRSADRASREVGNFVNDAILDVGSMSNRRDVGTAVGDGLTRLQALTPNASYPNGETLRDALSGQPPLVSNIFIDSLADELIVDGVRPEVTLVSRDGVQLASSERNLPTLYNNDAWFRKTMTEGWAARSLVTGEVMGLRGDEMVVMSSEEAFEISQRVSVFADDNIVGVIRVRYPLTIVHGVLDEIIVDSDSEVAISLLDKSASLLLADTSNSHDPNFLYQPAAVAGGSTTLNLDLLQPGTARDENFLTAARSLDASGGVASEFNWLLQVRQPIDVATAPLAELRQVSTEVGNTRSLVSFGVLSLVLISLYVGYRASRRIANRITQPVREIAAQAEAAASEGIPRIVAAAEHSEEDLPELPSFQVDTEDEIAILADSLNIMQGAAVELAAGQAKLRRQNVARTFVSLGRRNQNLLNRQLAFIDDLERSETDPDTLEDLFRLDHLATRMRRNAENLLVLAGEQTPRRWAKPIALRDVLQASSSEIADFGRVRIGEIDEATVTGSVATDVSHLVAELLENAGAFSPPNSPIDVLGQQTPSHYRLAVMDQGIGMDDGALAQANHRLANPVDFADAPSAYIGLFVVGHLARQLGVKIRLANSEPVNIGSETSAPTGTIAFIDIPNALLSSAEATPIEMPARAQRIAPAPAPVPPTIAKPTPPSQSTSGPVTSPEVARTEAGFPKRGGKESPPVTDWTTPEPALASSSQDTVTIPLADAAVTTAGFPKRNAGAAEAVRDAPKRMDVAEPSALEPPSHASTTPIVPADAPVVPTEVQTVVTEALPLATQPEVTDSGFPKRRAAQTSIADTPVAMDVAPATEPSSTDAEIPAVTEAGFPKRQAAEPLVEPVAALPEVDAIKRDATTVSSSLLSFKAAVARGRKEAAAPEQPTPIAQSPQIAAATAPVPTQVAAPAPASAKQEAVAPPPTPTQTHIAAPAPVLAAAIPPEHALTQLHQMTEHSQAAVTSPLSDVPSTDGASPQFAAPEASEQINHHNEDTQPTGSTS